MIPIEQIHVVNPRSRGQFKFRQIADNITMLGLKRPITVARRTTPSGTFTYDLVCGQGRLEACRGTGSQFIPAIVLEISREELLLMSLVENLARKRNTTVEMAKEIAAMKERGVDFSEIARRTNLDITYVRGIIRLLNKGESGLLRAVESGHIPISVAMTIACSDDEAVQRALTEAYENKNLRGKALLKARRLIDLRRAYGKDMRNNHHNGKEMSADKLVRAYQLETNRQRHVVCKAKVCEMRLLFVVSAVKSLIQDEGFVNLLRAEALDSLPQYIAQQIKGG
ncbi:MAG: plasmid partitioning protein RepB C-terminal domain-containing protein [Phycisphaerae bacterium]